MKTKVSQFDVAEYLDDEKTIAEYLNAVMEEGDISLLISAIGDIAKARGMSQIAAASGLGRESLYKTLNPNSKPRFETMLKVLKAFGISMQFSAPLSKRSRKKLA